MVRCEICSIDLVDGYSYQGHLQGKRHKVAEQKYAQINNSIFVTGLYRLNTTANAIKKFFSAFGDIKYFRCNSNYAIIEYNHSRPAQILLNQPIYFNDQRLEIKRRIINNPSRAQIEEEKKDTWECCYEKLKSQLIDKATFQEQLDFLLSTINLTSRDLELIYNNICQTLKNEFRQIYPHCQVHKFGSTVNGLGFKHCDLDIYIDIGTDYDEKERDHVLYTKKVFLNAKKLMYRKNRLFSKIIPIPRAKTPIIKFTHVPTGVSCDVNFKNDLGVHNSCLIKHLLSYDTRLKPTMLVIKYWAKEFELTGCNKITNYSLVMMFIFYIQQPTVALIPTIYQLREGYEATTVEGWNVGFNKNYKHNNSDNKMTVAELVMGFLEFYSKFNFQDMVICPLDGIAHPKKSFSNLDNLPDCMNGYKEYVSFDPPTAVIFNAKSPMCIQDPNELCYNITAGAQPFVVENLVRQCQISYEACSQVLASDNQSLHDFLPNLFTVTDPDKNTKKRNKPIKFNIKPETEPTDVDIWYKQVVDCVCDIFQNIYQFRLKKSPPEAKQQKLDDNSDVHSNDETKQIFACSGDFLTWRNRKGNLPPDQKNASFRDKEIFITNTLIKKQEELAGKSTKPIVDFLCTLQVFNNPTRMAITLNNVKSIKPAFYEMAGHLKTKLTKQIATILEESREKA